MQKNLLMAAVTLLITASACSSNATENASESSIAPKKGIAIRNTHRLNLSDFESIKQGKGRVTYNIHQGNIWIVEISGSNAEMEKYDIRVEGKTLVVEGKGKEKQYSSGRDSSITLDITMPNLRHIEATHSSTWNIDRMRVGDMSFICRGACDINLSDFVCDNLDMDNRNCTDISGKLKVKKKAKITNCGASDFKTDIVCDGVIEMDNSGASDIKSNMKAHQLLITTKGAGDGNMTIEADNMTMKNSGASDMDFTFKGKKISIEDSGAGDIDANITCDTVKASCKGAGSIKLKGTADNVEIDSAGASSIDTSKLNNY